MATMNRNARDIESREQTARYVYKPSSTLPDPNPIPGWSFRYVATAIMSVSDPTNVSKKMRDGWEPVKAEDHPELMLGPNATGNVEIGGLMLCKMPTERLKAMEEYFQNHAKSQMESVDNNFMRQQDPRMPLFSEKRSSTTRGSSLS